MHSTSKEVSLFAWSSLGSGTAAPWPWSETIELCLYLKPHCLIWYRCDFLNTWLTPLTQLLQGKARGLERGVCKSAFSYPTGYAIRRAAEADLVRLRRYEIPIKRVARNLCLDPALIGGIMSQESRVGLLLDNGWDRGQQKYGLMQVLQGDKCEKQHSNVVHTPGLYLSKWLLSVGKGNLSKSKAVLRCCPGQGHFNESKPGSTVKSG